MEVVAATRSGYVFAWRTRGAAWGEIQWPTFAHDNRSTGNLHTPLPVVLPPELDDCSCATQPSRAPGLAWVAILAPAALIRRRRR